MILVFFYTKVAYQCAINVECAIKGSDGSRFNKSASQAFRPIHKQADTKFKLAS